MKGLVRCIAVGVLAIAAQSSAQSPTVARPVMQITVVDTHGNQQAYLSLVKLVIERQHVVAPGIDTKIFRATFAGESTGLLYIVLTYPNVQFMIDAHGKLEGDVEWNRLRKEVALKTERTIQSDSLFSEVTP